MKFTALLLSSLLALSANAGILTTENSGKSLEGVALAKSAKVELEKQSIELQPIGAGLRTKKVILLNVKVYVGQLLSSDASKFARNEAGALKSLDDSRTTVMSLTFLRTVDAPTVQQSFKDALKANNVDVNEASIAAFLKLVQNGGDAVEGKTLIFATQKNADGTETATYEDAAGKANSVTGPKGFTTKIMSMWLGTPADAGVAGLKASVIKGN